MKNTIKCICLLISALILFSSCQSVYEIPLETTAPPEGLDIDPDQEYFTMGHPYRSGDPTSGLLYEGCLIYIEKVPTTGIIGYKGSGTEKTPIYGDTYVERVVKYNPVTGVVSSPCLIPTCNHSLESDCPLLFERPDERVYHYYFRGIFGDWLVIFEQYRNEEYVNLFEETFYNLKTGEVRRAFDDELGSNVLIRWNGGSYHDGKYYVVKQILDYSKTGYKPGVEGQSIKNYEPITKQYLYEYDFEAGTSKELFYVSPGFNIGAVSSQRFYFGDDTRKIVSYPKDATDGSGKQTEKTMSGMGVSNFLGYYCFYYKNNGYTVYNRKNDEKNEIVFDYSITCNVCVTERGVLSCHQTAYDEWKDFSSKEYKRQNPQATSKEVNAAARKILGSGKAQIWKCGFMGEDQQVIFELECAYIEIIAAQGDYVFATIEHYDPETGDVTSNPNGHRCVINTQTGEITEIPFLDIVVPDEYLN